MYQFQQKELKYHILYFFNPMSQNGTGFRRMTHMHGLWVKFSIVPELNSDPILPVRG